MRFAIMKEQTIGKGDFVNFGTVFSSVPDSNGGFGSDAIAYAQSLHAADSQGFAYSAALLGPDFTFAPPASVVFNNIYGPVTITTTADLPSINQGTDMICVNSAAPITIPLPVMTVGHFYTVSDISDNASVNNITVTNPLNGNSKIANKTSAVIKGNSNTLQFQFNGTKVVIS